MTNQTHQPDHIAIGRITKPHGVRGELKVEIMTDDPARFGRLETVFLGRHAKDRFRTYTVSGYRFHKDQVLIQFEEINSREDANRLRSQTIFVPIEEAIPLEQGEFFLFQLYGMSVQTEDGEEIGQVEEVLQTGANDVFVIRRTNGKELLIPDTEDVVLDVDGATRTITIQLIPGLLTD